MFFFFLIKLNVQGKKQVQMEKIFRMIDFINSIFFKFRSKRQTCEKKRKIILQRLYYAMCYEQTINMNKNQIKRYSEC